MAFKGTTIPKLPEGFIDRTYGNDVCSHWEKEWNGYVLEVWIEKDEPDEREAIHQYLICIGKPEETEFEDGKEFSINDVSETGLLIASKQIKAELWRLMKKYY